MEVTRDSAVERIGLKKGDVLVSIDGEKVQTSRDVVALARVRQYYWKLVIRRDGELMTTNIGG
jgi:S1-C subfamily serine protease